MGQYNLNRIFKPRHVAVVGASEKAGTIGNALMKRFGGYARNRARDVRACRA